MIKTNGYAAQSATTLLAPYQFEHRNCRPTDVHISIDYCGICHSDIHQVRGEWGNSIYPMVPGHEIVGRVVATGNQVQRFKPGDLVGVGVMVQSCMQCKNCLEGEEPYCTKGMVCTYNARDYDGQITFGGYARDIVADEHFVFSISSKLNAAAVAPLLCAGITTYSPLRHWGVGPNMKVGVVGLGGLGHMALKFAHSFGAHVTQFTTSESKIQDAKKLGADEVIISRDSEAMQKHSGSFDFILDCVSAAHDINAYLNLLRLDGMMCLVGLPQDALNVSAFSLAPWRRSFAGSMIGGIPQTQEMLDYCARRTSSPILSLYRSTGSKRRTNA